MRRPHLRRPTTAPTTPWATAPRATAPRATARRPERGAALAASLLLLPLAACQGGEPADGTFDALATGLAARDLGGVPVDDPTATDQLAAIWAAVPEDQAVTVEAGEVTTEDDTASATLAWSWQLDGTEWSYETPVEASRVEDAWQVSWTPALVAPDLAEGEALAIDSLTPERGQVLGAGDVTIVGPRPVVRLGLDKTQAEPGEWTASARSIARELDLGVADYVARVEAAGEKAFVEALVLRAEDARDDPVPRATATSRAPSRLEDTVPLAPTREFAAPILGTRRRGHRGDRRGARTARSSPATSSGCPGSRPGTTSSCAAPPGVRVSATGGEADRDALRAGADRGPAAAHHPRPGSPAEGRAGPGRHAGRRAPSSRSGPPTGDVLAAASGPGSDGLNTATFGQYAPGSTFKVVSSLALLRAGLTPESPVACAATTVTVDGKTVQELRRLPRRRARQDHAAAGGRQLVQHRLHLRARSGSTDGDLAEAAAALGPRGRPRPRLPGVLRPGAAARRARPRQAADLIGQGKVLASPMAMAAVAASVRAGRDRHPAPAARPTRSRPPPTGRRSHRGRGRAAARADAGRGDRGRRARSSPTCPAEVGAKTGTAEYGTGRVAAADAHLDDRDPGRPRRRGLRRDRSPGSRTAGPLLEQFLR